MQKSVVFGIIGLLVGLVIGFFGANTINRNSQGTVTAALDPTVPGAAAPPAAAAQGTGPMLADIADVLAKAESEPQNFAVQMRTGDMYAQIGRFEKAVEFYSRGVRLKPDDFNANVVLANAYFDSRQFEKAADHYAKALEINPKDVNARTDLGTSFVERPNPDYDRAIAEFNNALGVNPNHEPSLYYLGVAQFRKGETDEAQKTLSRLEQAHPNSALIERLRQQLAPK